MRLRAEDDAVEGTRPFDRLVPQRRAELFQAGEAGVFEVVFEAETEGRIRSLQDLHGCRGDLGANPVTRRHEQFHQIHLP